MRNKHLLKRFLQPAIYVVTGWALACPPSSQAANTNVNILDTPTATFGSFSPAAVTINAHDQVTWVWVGSLLHSTTSNTGVWDSGLKSGPPNTFPFTFNSAGSYPYFCSTHFFTGSVTVRAVNVPPSAAITSPTNGATFAAPWTGTIQAAVSDSDGTVSKVEFFAGATLLGTVNNPTANPSITVTNLAANSYRLTAVATDNGGATTTSAGVTNNVVTPVAIVLSSPQRASVSSFQFSYSANPGLSYIVLRAGGLPGLLPISTNKAASSTVNFLDSNATGDMNFYGVHLAPNP
jgi:plastocyanin